MGVRPNERWAWLDHFGLERDGSVQAYFAYANAWFLVRQQQMMGPFQDHEILRMLRLAACPCVDGCQLGPPGLGWFELGQARASRREHYWQPVAECELPPSVTHYVTEDLKPVGCCCSTFDSWPQLRPGPPQWALFLEEEPQLWGYLQQEWNAHPVGSMVWTQEPMNLGLTVVDWGLSAGPAAPPS